MSQAFEIKGMSCGGCATRLMRVIGRMNGVKTVKVEFETASMAVDYDPDAVSVAQIVAKTEETGYEAKPVD